MTKVKVNLSIDSAVVEECKRQNINMSDTAEDKFKEVLSFGTLEARQKSLILEEIKFHTPIYQKEKSIMTNLYKELSLIEEEERKAKENDLEEQKQRIKESHNCRICNNYIEFLADFAEPFDIKGILFDGVCKSCFSNKNPRFWIDKADEERAKIAEGDND